MATVRCVPEIARASDRRPLFLSSIPTPCLYLHRPPPASQRARPPHSPTMSSPAHRDADPWCSQRRCKKCVTIKFTLPDAQSGTQQRINVQAVTHQEA